MEPAINHTLQILLTKESNNRHLNPLQTPRMVIRKALVTTEIKPGPGVMVRMKIIVAAINIAIEDHLQKDNGAIKTEDTPTCFTTCQMNGPSQGTGHVLRCFYRYSLPDYFKHLSRQQQ
jgi:hypothetical protein